MEYYSYIRCSTTQQKTDRQHLQLKEFCQKEGITIPTSNIVEEKRSGTDDRRPFFNKLVQDLIKLSKEGKEVCLVLIELSRMGRSYLNTKKVWNELTSNNVKIVVVNFPLLDTRTKEDSTVKVLISDIVFSVLNYITEQELKDKEERCSNGRRIKQQEALSKGIKYFGRKALKVEDIPSEVIEVIKEYKSKGLSKKDMIALVNTRRKEHLKKEIARTTFYKYFNMLK